MHLQVIIIKCLTLRMQHDGIGRRHICEKCNLDAVPSTRIPLLNLVTAFSVTVEMGLMSSRRWFVNGLNVRSVGFKLPCGGNFEIFATSVAATSFRHLIEQFAESRLRTGDMCPIFDSSADMCAIFPTCSPATSGSRAQFWALAL